MIITVLTMFPELLDSFLSGPIARRASERGIADIRIVDIRDYAGGCYRHIDDGTYGGGAGMVLRARPVLDALRAAGAADADHPGCVVSALTPVGQLYRQETAVRYAQLEHLVLICGHYEGMDERIYSHVDERISIGDYILSGGEFAAQVVIDSVLRLLPGVLRAESTTEESFSRRGLLEYPQYTRPADLDGDRVPEVLLSGNHEEIRRWRLRESLRATLRERPELFDEIALTDEEQEILEGLQAADERGHDSNSEL